MKIPFLSFNAMHPPLREEMIRVFTEFYDRQYYVLGKSVEQFESDYAQFNQVKHCIGVSNGLDAIYLALKALGIGPGDEVIVPSNTFIASVLAISYTGAKPVFVEADRLTYNIDPKLIEQSITKKTKAIIPVHLYGQAAEMTQIMELANRYGLWVVEDNAQAHGAVFEGKLTGSFGHLNATSFYPGKNLGALGDAGAVTTDSLEWCEKIKSLRNYGSRIKYHNSEIGHNMRLDELQAGILSLKLQHLTAWTSQRQEIAEWYKQELKDCSAIQLPFTHQDATHVYHLFVIRTNRRDALQQHLTTQGIGTLIHYPIPPHLQEAYHSLGHKKGDFPIAEELAKTSLSLPIWPGMTEEMVKIVCDQIKNFEAN
jgi:dTDP-4-amino-4,6-dideoxygalactose transaminase